VRRRQLRAYAAFHAAQNAGKWRDGTRPRRGKSVAGKSEIEFPGDRPQNLQATRHFCQASERDHVYATKYGCINTTFA
jgi:hypothetical protein